MLSVLLSLLAVVAPMTPLRVVHAFEPVGRYAAGDRGADLAGVPGQVVVSATAGTVLFAGPVAGRGVVSIGLGDGRRLTYEPVAPSVRVGTRVVAGGPIGRLTAGRAGCPAPACLHWGLVTGHGPALAYADPLSLLDRAQVRLLPLTGGVRSGPGPSIGSPPARARTPSAARPAVSSDAPPAAASDQAHSTRAAGAAALAGAGTTGLALGAAFVRRRARMSRRARRA